MNTNKILLIQFDVYLSRNSKYLFTDYDLEEILARITKSQLEKKYCLDFFIKNKILIVADGYNSYYYTLEKIQLYKICNKTIKPA